MTRPRTNTLIVVHRIAFAVAIVVYAVGCWMLTVRRPDIVQTVAQHPTDLRTILFVAAVVAIGVLLWPFTGWLARSMVNSDDHIN